MMAQELSYRTEAAAEYDRAFSHVSTYTRFRTCDHRRFVVRKLLIA
jgi:hypothetical protein